jgi:hypothetical protein
MTGLPSKHFDPNILTLAGQVGACRAEAMSAAIVPSAVCTDGSAVFPPAGGSGAQAGITRYKAVSARPRQAATGLRPLNRVGRSGGPPTNFGFRLVAAPSRSVAPSVVRNVTKLLRRTWLSRQLRVG